MRKLIRLDFDFGRDECGIVWVASYSCILAIATCSRRRVTTSLTRRNGKWIPHDSMHLVMVNSLTKQLYLSGNYSKLPRYLHVYGLNAEGGGGWGRVSIPIMKSYLILTVIVFLTCNCYVLLDTLYIITHWEGLSWWISWKSLRPHLAHHQAQDRGKGRTWKNQPCKCECTIIAIHPLSHRSLNTCTIALFQHSNSNSVVSWKQNCVWLVTAQTMYKCTLLELLTNGSSLPGNLYTVKLHFTVCRPH